ncbi:uncharacterized protein MELLADRAFT_55481 [Melampsora larici-populina 98AG31]|uniref:Uncharacterized protein n=1 Tax=Melampsora larici-populina (strain 98AG31 / pathotype 3-4-7) TaxID=747676 RepID=F4RFD7_MELLP|nr:uncharacterized protein MELLADRAFT_55481 [Melampsora larici-populina 98AG31]EGG08953.1 hypothetical protein MELLADRAFT_55481 [Melampsora larici-populina 98AG31]
MDSFLFPLLSSEALFIHFLDPKPQLDHSHLSYLNPNLFFTPTDHSQSCLMSMFCTPKSIPLSITSSSCSIQFRF